MRLITQLITMKLQRFEENKLNKNYPLALWNFYQAHSLAKAFLRKESDFNIPWKRLVLNQFKDQRLIMRIFERIPTDLELINDYFRTTELSDKEEETFAGSKWMPGTIGIASYEWDEE